jgi:hypothetical protein
VLSEPPKGLGKAQLEYLKLTREQIDITAGTRFPEFAGSSVLGIAAGHGIDELDKWAHEEGIDRYFHLHLTASMILVFCFCFFETHHECTVQKPNLLFADKTESLWLDSYRQCTT